MPPTDAQVLAAARMLCKIHAGQCQVDEDDTWKVYGEQFKDDARDTLLAALSAQPVAGAVAEPDCWAILTPNGSKLVSPDEAKGRKDAYPLYAAPQPQAAPAPEPTSDETLTWEKPPSAIEGRLGVWLTSGAELHPRTVNLVVRFARALASKLAAAEAKYGYSDGWASPDWMDECRAKLMEHIAKGDPRDVAAYCAFLWHHGASTARPEPSAQAGWKLVPVEATPDMCKAAVIFANGNAVYKNVAAEALKIEESIYGEAYSAMLAASPQPEPSAQGRPCPFGCTTQEEHDAHQSAEPSAQGEPVAWRPGDPIYDDAYVRGVAVGFAEDDSRRTTLLRIADRMQKLAAAPQPEPSAQGEPVACVTEEMVTAYLTANDAYWKRIDGEPTKLGKWRNGTPSEATRVSLMAALAAAPSTPPPAVVEAVPQAWPIERAADMLTAYAELVKATGRYAEEHYIPEIENVAAELRGIAPKAAQEPRDA